MNPTIESDHSYTVPRSRRPKLEQWEITPCDQDKKEAHSSKDLGPPPPPLPPAEEPHIPKGRYARMSGSMAALMAQFQQRHDSWSREATPLGMPEKVPPMAPTAFGTPGKAATPRETPTKETPWKSEQMPSKKGLTPDTTPEPPVKKQQTGSPSSDRGMIPNMATRAKIRKRRKRRRKRKNEKVRPPQPPTRRPMRLKNSRRNANGQRSGNTSCRHLYGSGRATTSSCTIYHCKAAAATSGT